MSNAVTTTVVTNIEWGSVADWVSGIGSMAAVFAALTIAFMEWRRAKRSERNAQQTARDKLQALTSEAVRVAEHMAYICDDLLDDVSRMNDTMDKELADEFLKDMAGLKAQIESLQSFPQDDPRLFVELDSLKSLCVFEADWIRHSPEIAEVELGDRLPLIRDRGEAIKNLSSLL